MSSVKEDTILNGASICMAYFDMNLNKIVILSDKNN